MTLQHISALSDKPDAMAAAAVVQQVEAARYAVLRRLAPSLRHHMVRPLQPIGLVYGVMHHKLSTAQPDLQAVRQDAEKINDFAKAAIVECMDMGSWIAPEPDVFSRIDTAVRECVGLTATMLHFCGFRLVNEVEELPALVLRDAVRTVLSGAILAITDALDAPATLLIRAVAGTADITLSVHTEPSGEGSVERYDDGYRLLAWGDVQALAAAAQVGLARQDQTVTLRFAVGQPATA